MNRHLGVGAILALAVGLLTLASCDVLAGTPSISRDGGFGFLPLSTETSRSVPCEACAQATLAVLQTQEKSSADAQAAATAEIMRANAQATLNSVGATLSAAQTQEQNNANIIAAQVAATAEIVRANAQATLVAAGSTQSAALTQDAIHLTQVQYSIQVTADLATQNAIATVTQQNNNFLAASTQTAVADNVATQTQSAVATTQWYTDQARQREEQRQGPLTFLWMWCPPLFIISIALVCLLFFWRWMKIRETQQRIDMQPTAVVVITPEPLPISDAVNNQYQLAKPRDNVRRWLEEVKRKLLASKKDDDDNPDS
jgi:hypothetical protein